jgi:hypothetical protein
MKDNRDNRFVDRVVGGTTIADEGYVRVVNEGFEVYFPLASTATIFRIPHPSLLFFEVNEKRVLAGDSIASAPTIVCTEDTRHLSNREGDVYQGRVVWFSDRGPGHQLPVSLETLIDKIIGLGYASKNLILEALIQRAGETAGLKDLDLIQCKRLCRLSYFGSSLYRRAMEELKKRRNTKAIVAAVQGFAQSMRAPAELIR